MNPNYLNCRSEFSVGDRVIVSPTINRKNVYTGTVSYIESGLYNKGIERGPTTDYIYVSMDDRSVYRKHLSQGSSIIALGKLLIIRDIKYDHKKEIIVINDDGKYNIGAVEYKISEDSIDSMLIWREGFIIYN